MKRSVGALSKTESEIRESRRRNVGIVVEEWRVEGKSYLGPFSPVSRGNYEPIGIDRAITREACFMAHCEAVLSGGFLIVLVGQADVRFRIGQSNRLLMGHSPVS